MKKIKVGYLPFYIKLYDDSNPASRDPMVAWMKKLIRMIEDRGVEVEPAEVCRVKSEFDRAAAKFNADGDICAVVTQHLAYSPSQESVEALKSLKVPVIVLDTTPDRELLSFAETENRIMNNHGIHGVQDTCNMLRRNGIPYHICVGHADDGRVIDELCGYIRAAYAAKVFRNARVGMAGGEFEGMGDFRVSDERYEKEIGAKTVRMTPADAEKYLDTVTDKDVEDEIALDAAKYNVRVKDAGNYRASVRAGLALRRWMEAERLDGVTVNFLHIDESGLPKMPFAECCKAMERGLGYAGEGDNLTAGLVASLIRVYPDTTFTEMFCPDWKENIILLSHMGEFNPTVAKWTNLDDKPFNYNSTGNTVGASGCLKAGEAVLVNLAPAKEGFELIVTPVKLADDGSETGAYSGSVQGWMKPRLPLPEFLKAYSMAGGTHHSALVYGADMNELIAFGEMMGFRVTVI